MSTTNWRFTHFPCPTCCCSGSGDVMSGVMYSFWRHRDRNPPQVSVRTEHCDCCYCIYSPKANQVGSVARELSPKRSKLSTKQRSLFSVTSYAGQTIAGCDETGSESRSTGSVKTNQDSLVMLEDRNTRSLVLACLDGHGIHGHIISQFFKYGLETRLFSNALWKTDPQGAISQLLVELEDEICQFPQVETQFSGTTLVMVVVRGDQLLVVNIGDSRAILGSTAVEGDAERCSLTVGEINEAGKILDLTPIPLTTDHKPEVPGELSRILKAGGRVLGHSVEGPGAAMRVWLNDEDLPGLAMSRSLGDEVARSIGVISTPEFSKRQLDDAHDCILVLGTDGLWDYLSNDEVIGILAGKVDASSGQCVVSVINEAKKRWENAEGRRDDITACVATLSGRKKQRI